MVSSGGGQRAAAGIVHIPHGYYERSKGTGETFAERYTVIDLERVKRILSKDVHIFPDKER
jgi:hypothetical protein